MEHRDFHTYVCTAIHMYTAVCMYAHTALRPNTLIYRMFPGTPDAVVLFLNTAADQSGCSDQLQC